MSDELKQVGPRLRAERRARGWTLEGVSARTGLSVSTLSRLESGKREPSLAQLVTLTRLLGLRLDDLIAPTTPDPRVRRPVWRRNGMVIAPLAPEHAPIHTYKITYPPVASPPEQRVHSGYEWLYVLSGRLRLLLGDQELILARGEAAEFDTHIPHSISAAGSRPAQVISIFNETGARMHIHAPDPDGATPDGKTSAE